MSRITYNANDMTIEVEGVEDISRSLGLLRSKTPAVIKTALNATARQARRLMIQQAKARYAVNAAGQKHLKDLTQKKKATNSSLSATLHIRSFRNDLGYFQHSPTAVHTGRDVANSPEFYRAKVLKSARMKALTGQGKLSKGFLLKFSSGHIGMVQRHIGSHSAHLTTRRGYPRWKNRDGQVEKLVTMGSPSATAMHHTVWPMVEPEVEEYLMERMTQQAERVLEQARARARRGR